MRAQAQVSGSANIVEGSAHFTSDGVTVDAQGAVGVSGSASAGASLGADGLSAEVHGRSSTARAAALMPVPTSGW